MWMVVDAPEDSPNFTELVEVKSPCYVPEGREGWWGGPDTRLRCRADDKVVFFSEADAQKAANRATNRGDPMVWYRGKCGHLHVARKRKPKRG